MGIINKLMRFSIILEKLSQIEKSDKILPNSQKSYFQNFINKLRNHYIMCDYGECACGKLYRYEKIFDWKEGRYFNYCNLMNDKDGFINLTLKPKFYIILIKEHLLRLSLNKLSTDNILIFVH